MARFNIQRLEDRIAPSRMGGWCGGGSSGKKHGGSSKKHGSSGKCKGGSSGKKKGGSSGKKSKKCK